MELTPEIYFIQVINKLLTDKSCRNDFFPVSDDLYKKGMYVPSGSNLSRDDGIYWEIIEENFNKIKKELVIDNHKIRIVGLGYVGSAIYQVKRFP